MSKTIARSEITIVDLIDTATYIYYAKDDQGTGATSTPTSDAKYIGIYNGNALASGRPDNPPQGTVWSKYVGEDGQKGEGVSIVSTFIEYAEGTSGTEQPESGWQDTVPSLKEGEYLWTRTTVNYSDGKSTVSYSVSCYGKDGKDANAYYIETNQEEILRFIEGENMVYSPETLTFKIFKAPKQPNDAQISLTNNDFKLEILGNDTPLENGTEYLRLGFISSSQKEDEDIVYEEKDTNTVYFNLQNFMTETKTDKLLFFRFSYLIDNKVAAIKIIEIRNGVSDEMAKFEQYSNGITAAIQNNRLVFDATGLSIQKKNGDDLDKVFYANESGDLFLKGTIYATDGVFSGELDAATGSFEGKITATSGSIGGLTISDEAIYQGSDIENSALIIRGNGNIEAENITLGNGTVIKNYIKLGDENNTVYIRTPSEGNNTFLESGKISLKSNGYLNIGNIELYGGDGSYGSAYLTSGKENASFWKIKDDGTAQFRELTVDKITVQNSIMEIGKVQAVGSIMFFKDSWKVLSIEEKDGKKICELEVTLKNDEGKLLSSLTEGDYILANGNDYYKVEGVEDNKITLNKECDISRGDIITKIGKNDDYLITVQGDSNQVFAHSTKNSLTMSSIITNENSGLPGYEKKLVLGDLTGIDPSYKTGLYAENVFLNGTLTTRIEADEETISYAGINTLTGASAIKFGTDENSDKSKIVFWAGSNGTSIESIRNANFQVTEKGSIYASQGIFEGTLITNSTIKGASIHTAKIYGENQDGGAAALQIFDTKRGIEFIKQDGEYNTPIEGKDPTLKCQLKISSNGFYNDDFSQEEPFIGLIKQENELEKSYIFYKGNQLRISNQDKNQNINIEGNYIGYSTDITGTINQKIIMSDNQFDFWFTGSSSEAAFQIGNSLVTSTQKVNFQQNVVFGEGETGILEYQTTNNGYNLFVR